MVCDIDFIIITGNICARSIIFPSLNWEYYYTKDPCPIHFTITFAGQTNVDHYTGNVVTEDR